MKTTKEVISERNLIKKATDYLDKFSSDIQSTNNARFPSIVVGLGGKSEDALFEISKNLAHNWSNAMHLEYLCAQYDKKFSLKSKRFRTQSEVDNESDEKGEDVRRDEWVESGKLFNEEAVSAQNRMLEKRDIFSDTNSIKVDFILDATEDNAEKYYDFFRGYELTSNHKLYKTLFLLLSQVNLQDSLLKSEKMLQRVLSDKNSKECCVFLISDELNDGSRLSKEDLKTNYRLIADLIFLGGDKQNERQGLPVINNGVKLAAYTNFSKPIAQISEVTIGHLINKIYEEEEKRFSNENITLDEIKNRLGINKDGRIRIAENEWYNKFIHILPKANQDPVPFFPYSEKNGANKFIRLARKDLIYAFKELNNMTFGVSEAYIEKHYLSNVQAFLDNSANKEDIIQDIKRNFNFFELLKIDEFYSDLVSLVKVDIKINVPEGKEDNVFTQYALQRAKHVFYKKFREKYCEVLREIIDSAKSFKENYKLIKKDIEIARSINGEEEQSLEDFYGHQVLEYIGKIRGNSNKIAFEDFFDVSLNREKMIQRLFEIYKKMVCDVPIFKWDFEAELKAHLDTLKDGKASQFINNHFADEKQRNLRMHASGLLITELTLLEEYYLLNKKAEYYGELKKSEDFSNGKYKLVELNRSDCIEQLAVYEVKKDFHILSDFTQVDKSSNGNVKDKKEAKTDTVRKVSKSNNTGITNNDSELTEQEKLQAEFDAL